MSQANNSQSISAFWDVRFASEEYIYGTEPNQYFKSVIDDLQPGVIFIPGAGEGRDAVYAATLGWQVICADLSAKGKAKALRLAKEKGVSIEYNIVNINDVAFPSGSLDMIASVYFHLPPAEQTTFYQHVEQWLKPGGTLVLEAFTPAQLGNGSGGPKDIAMLLTADQLRQGLPNMKFAQLEEATVELQEGTHHRGLASVVHCRCTR